jgi:hypothetical protein
MIQESILGLKELGLLYENRDFVCYLTNYERLFLSIRF